MKYLFSEARKKINYFLEKEFLIRNIIDQIIPIIIKIIPRIKSVIPSISAP